MKNNSEAGEGSATSSPIPPTRARTPAPAPPGGMFASLRPQTGAASAGARAVLTPLDFSGNAPQHPVRQSAVPQCAGPYVSSVSDDSGTRSQATHSVASTGVGSISLHTHLARPTAFSPAAEGYSRAIQEDVQPPPTSLGLPTTPKRPPPASAASTPVGANLPDPPEFTTPPAAVSNVQRVVKRLLAENTLSTPAGLAEVAEAHQQDNLEAQIQVWRLLNSAFHPGHIHPSCQA